MSAQWTSKEMRRMSERDVFWDTPVIFLGIDACAYFSGKPVECVEALKHVYDVAGIDKELRIVDSEQGLREKANASNLPLVVALREAMQLQEGLFGREEQHYLSFLRRHFKRDQETGKTTVLIIPTSHCNSFRDVLQQQVIPERIVPIWNALQDVSEVTGSKKHADHKRERLWESRMCELGIEISGDTRRSILTFRGAFETVQTYAYMIMQRASPQELKDKNIQSSNDVEVVTVTGRNKQVIEHPAVIQALRYQPLLWDIVQTDPKVREAHHNCADRSYISLVLNKLPNHPESERAGFALFTIDAGLIKQAVSFTTGWKMTPRGLFRERVKNAEYRDMDVAKRTEFDDVLPHAFISSRFIGEFFRQRVDEIHEKAKPSQALHDALEKLITAIDEMEIEVARTMAGKTGAEALRMPYQHMVRERLELKAIDVVNTEEGRRLEQVRPSPRQAREGKVNEELKRRNDKKNAKNDEGFQGGIVP